ncbi:hypothetical protein [Spirosoma validum]|uniref:Uncharacterized protein n=1 Tax=Spirosoma validum TaxID=2771355 RepID=A0A927AZ91_9BACT|nr:hypothetical protein [Spirosoma validum]MBD2752600.1 hypothetical protein [Spirosoma validum]
MPITTDESQETIRPVYVVQSLRKSVQQTETAVNSVTNPEPTEDQLEGLTGEKRNAHFAESDENNQSKAVQKVRATSFHAWQCQHPAFRSMGLASLTK